MYRINRKLPLNGYSDSTRNSTMIRLILFSQPELHITMTDWMLSVAIDTEKLEYNAVLKESDRCIREDENAVMKNVTIPQKGIESLAEVAMNPTFMTLKDEEITYNFTLDGIDYHIDIQSVAGRFDHSSNAFMETMNNGIIKSTKGSFVTGLDMIYKAIRPTLVLEHHFPSPEKLKAYIERWNTLKDYVNQERALDKLYRELCPNNRCIEDILIKCSALNDFYSTNIFKVHNVAQHYMNMNIDSRLAKNDLSLVGDLSRVKINEKSFCFYSFASKYCSHHRPDVYPIYDSYVHMTLDYFKKRDHFSTYKSSELKDYETYCNIIQSFKSFYNLDSFSVKDLDKYLWQLGKDAFNPYEQDFMI